MKQIIMILAVAFILTPTSAFACGGYGERSSTDWDLLSVQLKVDEIHANRGLTKRTKRTAERYFKRLAKRHASFMKDGRISPTEQKSWDRAYIRTSKALERLMISKKRKKTQTS